MTSDNKRRLAEIDDILSRAGIGEASARSDTGALLLTSLAFLRRLLDEATAERDVARDAATKPKG